MSTDDPTDRDGAAGADREAPDQPEQREPADPVAAAGGEPGQERRIAEAADPTRVRRAPRYRNFATLGGLLGVLIAAIITPFAEETEFLDYGGLFIVVALTLAPVGILLACLIALLLDRRSR